MKLGLSGAGAVRRAVAAWIPICLGVSLGLGGWAQAQPAPYSIHDQNRDGYLDQDEYAALLSRYWARRAQGGRGPSGRPPLQFQQIDTDRDGLISEQEMGLALERRRQHRKWRRWLKP